MAQERFLTRCTFLRFICTCIYSASFITGLLMSYKNARSPFNHKTAEIDRVICVLTVRQRIEASDLCRSGQGEKEREIGRKK